MHPPFIATSLLALSLMQAPALSQTHAGLDEDALRAFVTQRLASADAGISRFEIQFGPMASPPDLAACRRVEPSLPAAARPWGRATISLRCTDGPAWTVLVPMTVRAWGPALVAAHPLAAGLQPEPADVRVEETEWTREPSAPLRDPVQLQGRTLVRSLLPGQPLRADLLRATTVLQAGDPVRLQIQGRGFAIVAAGQALAQAAAGQLVRVRTEQGKVLTGVARDSRTVEVTP